VNRLCSRTTALLASLLLTAGACRADPTSASRTVAVSATILAGCVISANAGQSTAIDFGLLDFGAQASTHIGSINAAVGAGIAAAVMVCTPGLALNVTVSGGNHAQASQRRMANAANSSFVPYGLYLDASHASALAVDVATSVAAATVSALNFLPLHGVATMGGANPAGAYSDTVAVTLSW
jgi:spore coat protein U-like protein